VLDEIADVPRQVPMLVDVRIQEPHVLAGVGIGASAECQLEVGEILPALDAEEQIPLLHVE